MGRWAQSTTAPAFRLAHASALAARTNLWAGIGPPSLNFMLISLLNERNKKYEWNMIGVKNFAFLEGYLYSELPSMHATDLRSLAAKLSSPDPSDLAVRAAFSLLNEKMFFQMRFEIKIARFMIHVEREKYDL